MFILFWLQYKGCGYLTAKRHKKLTDECSFIGSMLGEMINNPGPFIIQKVKISEISDIRLRVADTCGNLCPIKLKHFFLY
jgi:hypothetical protein